MTLVCCNRAPQRERCRGVRCRGVLVRGVLHGELVDVPLPQRCCELAGAGVSSRCRRFRERLHGELAVLRPGSAAGCAAEPGFGLALFVCGT